MDSEAARALRRSAGAQFVPDLVLTGVADGDAGHAAWRCTPPSPPATAAQTAYACRGYACDEPTADPARLIRTSHGADTRLLASEKREAYRPAPVVGVRVEQRDRLPGPEARSAPRRPGR